MRSALRRENELSLLPALESAFAELDDGERDIHLPRLEIRVSDKQAQPTMKLNANKHTIQNYLNPQK